jgi:23S rRNA pseudouridine1911/1915/1917 synthase
VEHFRCSNQRAQELIYLGAIYRKGRRVLEDAEIKPGEHFTVYLDPKRFPVSAVDWKQAIVAQTSEYLVARKPPGIPAHATLDNLVDNVLFQLRELTQCHLLVTQRIDLPVGGLMVMGKTEDFQRRFNKWLESRQVEKRYRALVEAPPPEGRHVHFMAPSEGTPKRVSGEAHEGWLRCELTTSKPTEVPGPTGKPLYDVEVELHTGRTHQIRAQLAALGAPIQGDRLYGSQTRYNPPGSAGKAIALYSSQVGWPGPDGTVTKYQQLPPWAVSSPLT